MSENKIKIGDIQRTVGTRECKIMGEKYVNAQDKLGLEEMKKYCDPRKCDAVIGYPKCLLKDKSKLVPFMERTYGIMRELEIHNMPYCEDTITMNDICPGIVNILVDYGYVKMDRMQQNATN